MKEKKISLTTVLLLFIILILVILIMAGIIYMQNKEKEENIGEEKRENIYNDDYEELNKDDDEEKNEQNDLAKMDVDELVDDADYNYSTGIDSFTYTYTDYLDNQKEKTVKYEKNSLSIGTMNFNNTFKFPYININSEDVKKVNNEIKTLSDYYFGLFVDYVELMRDTENSANKEWEREFEVPEAVYGPVDYSVYLYDNILSVVIKEGPFTNYGYIYYTYNIDLNTKKVLSNKDLLKETNYDSEDKLNNAVKKQIEEACEENGGINFSTDVNENYNLYLKNKDKNSAAIGITDWHYSDKKLDSYKVQYFIDDLGKLNVVNPFSSEAGGYYEILTLD